MIASTDVLVVAPHAPELEGLQSLLTARLSGEVRGIRVSAKAVGIGLPGVSGGTVMRLEKKRPRAVILTGSCAAYPGRGLTPGQVVVVTKLVLADPAVLMGQAAFADPMTCSLEPDRAITSALCTTGTRTVTAAVTLAITLDPGLATRLAGAYSCDIEHHEAFGVALACAPYQLPFAAVLGVSHEVGPAARETWRVNHRAAAQAAASRVAAWLQNGASGLPHGA